MPNKRTLHAMLLMRLVLVTAVISVIVAAWVVVSERSRVIRVVEDRTLIRIGTLRMLILEQLDSPGLGDHAGSILLAGVLWNE